VWLTQRPRKSAGAVKVGLAIARLLPSLAGMTIRPARLGVPQAEPRGLAANEPLRCQMDFTSPPSMRSVEPVIQRAPGDTRKAISSAISSGSP
jgi:hypothetical protein